MSTIEITCPHCGNTYEVELPEKVKKPRGQLAGIALADMTDEQLKRELINANSVLYKAKQRGASEEVIAANQARVDAAKAEKAKRHPVVEAVEAPGVEDAVYNEEAAAEIYSSAASIYTLLISPTADRTVTATHWACESTSLLGAILGVCSSTDIV